MKMCFDMMLHEVDEIVADFVLNEIINIQEESWKTVPQRSKGKTQRERTGLPRNNSSEIYDYGTEIVEVVQEHKAVQIEIDEEMYAQHNYAKDERDAMGRFIVEDGSYRMIPKPKLNTKENRKCIRMEMLNRPKDDGQAVGEAKSTAQKWYDKQENAKRAADKVQTQAVMDANRQTRN